MSNRYSMELVKKDNNIKRRLDHLENQLLTLHEVIVRKKENECRMINKNNQQNVEKEQDHPVHRLKLVHSRYQKTTTQNRLNDTKELCDYLQNLTKHIANGSNAMQKMASFVQLSYNPLYKMMSFPNDYHYGLNSQMNNHNSNLDFDIFPSICRDNPIFQLYCKNFKEHEGSRKQTRDIIAKEKLRIFDEVHSKQIEELKNELSNECKRREESENVVRQLEKDIICLAKKLKKASTVKNKAIKFAKKLQEKSNESCYEISNSRHMNIESKSNVSLPVPKKLPDMNGDHNNNHSQEIMTSNEYLTKNIEILKEKLQKETELHLEFKHRAEIAENALVACREEIRTEEENSMNKLLQMRKSYDKLLNSKKDLEKESSEQILQLIANNQHKEKELNKNLQTKNTSLENFKKQIARLTKEKNSLKMELEGTKLINSKLSPDFEALQQDNMNLKSAIDERDNIIKNLEEEINTLKNSLNNSETYTSEMAAKLDVNEETIASLKNELFTCQDLIKIKNKMLDDQLDTIKNLKINSESKFKLLTASEEQVKLENMHLQEHNNELLHNNSHLQKKLEEAKKCKARQEVNAVILKKLECKVFEKQKEWECEMINVCREKEEAMKAAKFASKKLIDTTNDYEKQIDYQKTVNSSLKLLLNEKSNQLNVANVQIELLNDQLWKSNQISEQMKGKLQIKLQEACEVCTDLLEDCCDESQTN